MRTAALLLALSAAAQGAETRHQRDAQTGIESWEATRGGVLVHLTQILPEQALAFFLGRGFPRAAAQRYAGSCVFMSIVRNVSRERPVEYRLGDWRYRDEHGKLGELLVKEYWLQQWQAMGLGSAQQIAFAWSQLPSEQRYARGDWNQGMTSYPLAHGSRFDLLYVWRDGDEVHRGELTGVRCGSAAQSD